MRRDEGEEEHPRLLVSGVFAQPADGIVAVADIVLLVGRVGGSGFVDADARIADQRAIADAAGWVADASNDVQWLDLARETIVVFGASEVELADGIDHIALHPFRRCPQLGTLPS